MRKTQPLLSLFNSQPAVFAGVCLPEEISCSEASLDRLNDRKTSTSISASSGILIAHQRVASLCAARVLYNPHSRE